MRSAEFGSHTLTTSLLEQWDHDAPSAAVPGSLGHATISVGEAVTLCGAAADDPAALAAVAATVATVGWNGEVASPANPGALTRLVRRAVLAQLTGSSAMTGVLSGPRSADAAGAPLAVTLLPPSSGSGRSGDAGVGAGVVLVHVQAWNERLKQLVVLVNDATELVQVPVALGQVLALHGRAGARADASASSGPHPAAGAPPNDVVIAAPSAAIVKQVLVAADAVVHVDQPVLVLSVMKMDIVLPSPVAGRVLRVDAVPGSAVRRGQALLTLERPQAALGPASRAQEGVASSPEAMVEAYRRRMDTLRAQLAPPWANDGDAPSSASSTSSADVRGWGSAVAAIGALQRQMDWAGHEAGIVRQLRAGKLTVRERIAQLVDPGSWREVGSLAGKMVLVPAADGGGNSLEGVVPANFVGGRGQVERRPIIVGGDDFTIRRPCRRCAGPQAALP